MRRWGFLLLFPLLMTACASGHYKIPQKEYRAKVRVLGVLPLLVDESSPVGHPQWGQVVNLLRRQNAGKELDLVRLLRAQNGYFDVRAVPGDPEKLFSVLVAGRAAGDKDTDQSRSYRFNPAAVADLARKNVVDALLVIIMNGGRRHETYWGRNHLNYLEADYDVIETAAAVVLPSGEVVWDDSENSAEPFLALQYPDFDEAYYNKTDGVNIKYITVAGLKRTLTSPGKSLFGQSTFPLVYRNLFKEISAALKPGLLNLF